MVFEQSVDTKLSLRELTNRIHHSTEYVNKYVSEHDGTSNPIQRVAPLTRIVRERLRLQILVKKFGKAYLDSVDKTIREISVFVLRNPQYLPQLESVGKQIEKNLKEVIGEESLEREKSHYLRTDAKSLLEKVKPTFKSVRRQIEKLQKKQQEKPHSSKQYEDEKKKRYEHYLRGVEIEKARALDKRRKKSKEIKCK